MVKGSRIELVSSPKCISWQFRGGRFQNQAEKPCLPFTTHMLSITLPYCKKHKPLCELLYVILDERKMYVPVCSPGHPRPAPSKHGWCWRLACGCSRSLCCGKRSTLSGLDWTCQSSLCSPAEKSAAIKLNLLVLYKGPCDVLQL